jgi:[ribosomal protein S5]-alanine N-acetyltransferase
MKNKPHRLSGGLIYLDPLGVEDVTDKYVGWLNDPEVNRYLEVRHVAQTKESVRAYVNTFYDAAEKYMWAVRVKGGAEMIGTATLQSFDRHNECAGIGMLIGDRDYWGTDASRQALDLVVSYAFEICGLHRILCHNISLNMQSNFMLQRAGFTREGVARKAFKVGEGEYVDGFNFSLLAEEWRNKGQTRAGE